MSSDDFKSCARHTVGDVVDSWDEVVLQPLIDLGKWFKSQDSTVQWLFGIVATGAGASAMAWVAKVISAGATGAAATTATELVLPILAALAVGVGIGTGLIVMAECGDRI